MYNKKYDNQLRQLARGKKSMEEVLENETVNLSNQVLIPQAQYAVYRNFSTEFHVCHEDHAQTQFG